MAFQWSLVEGGRRAAWVLFRYPLTLVAVIVIEKIVRVRIVVQIYPMLGVRDFENMDLLRTVELVTASCCWSVSFGPKVSGA